MPENPAPAGGEHVLFVHAHPDDESISSGGMIAQLTRWGTRVTVVTCTRGERGEVIPPDLAHLEGDFEALAVHREVELAGALAALGADGIFLGMAGARAEGLPTRRYTDSGMVWGPDGTPQPVADVAADALCSAELDGVAADLVAAIAATGADAVVSYDEAGGYGHPDHVFAHRAAREAARRAGVPFHVLIEDPAELRELEAAAEPRADVMLFDVAAQVPVVVAALRSHATQVTVAERPGEHPTFALSSGPERPIPTRQAVRLLDAPPAGAVPIGGQPTDAQPVGAPSTGAQPTGAQPTGAQPNGAQSSTAQSPAAQSSGGRAEAAESGVPEPETIPGRIASAFICLVIGALVGVLLTLNHQHTVDVAGMLLPIGVVVAVVLATALLVGMRSVFISRVPGVCVAIGLVAAVIVLSREGPGGSILVPDNTAGMVWAYAPALIALIVMAWPRVGTSARR